MNKTTLSPSSSPKAVGPYNHGCRMGDLLFTAGQIPLDPNTNTLVEGDIQAQTQQVLENLQSLLQSQGLNLSHVLKTTVFMTDLAEFGGMNEVYARYFQTDHPARSTIQVAALPMGARVEIEAIAHA